MTVIKNVGLVLKDSKGNKGILKSFTDNDINKISNAITDVGQVVDPATHMPIEATKTSAGVVQLATAQDITNGTAGKVVDAQELNNFAQTLPAANGVTDVSSGDNSNQLVVSRIGGSKTLTIDNVEHAGNADEATHASQADTATSANSVAWDNVSGKPSTFAPATHNHDDRYYTESEINTKLNGKSDTTHNHNSTYLGINAKAASAKSADSVAWNNVSGKPSSYTPSSHTHTKSQITDFPTIPSKTSQLTNDSGYITSSGSCNYANSAGSSSIAVRDSGGTWISGRDNAIVKQTRHSTNDGNSWNPAVSIKTKNGNWTIGTVGYDRLQFSYDTDADYNAGNNRNTVVELNPESGTIITSANIGSQSVNYANSSGNADTVDGSHAWQMQTLATGGGVHGSNDWLMQCQHNVDGDGYFKLYCGDKSVGTKVDRASSAGYADSAGKANYLGDIGSTDRNSVSGTGWYSVGFSNKYDEGHNELAINNYWGIRLNCRDSDHVTINGNRIIDSDNIGSQSVNYAKSAGSVAWGNVSGRPDIWIG